MRRAIGPIVTTGVAMVAAGVVVANPILAPRGDVQIPAVALSAGTADNMLDKSFLDAIAPAPPESNSPFSVLKQLVSALAADATYLGKNAIVDAFVAGVGAVTGPDLSPAPDTYLPPPAPPVSPVIVLPPPDLSNLVPPITPHVDASVLSSTIASVPAELANVTSTFINGSVVPVVEQVVSSIAYDATYVGKNVLTAAFAVGAAVAAEPGLISDTLKALVNGDIGGALQNAVKAVVKAVETPITSSMLIINAVKDIIENHLTELENFFFPIPQGVIVPGVPTAEQPAASAANGRRSFAELPGTGSRTARSVSAMALSPRSVAAKPRAAGASAASAASAAPRQIAGAVRDAITSVGEQVSAAVQNPAAAAGKATARARVAAAR